MPSRARTRPTRTASGPGSPDRARAARVDALGSRREKAQRLAMARSHDREVPTVERCDLRLTEALAESDDRRVDEPQIEVGVLALELSRSLEVVERQRLQPIGAGGDVVHEHVPRLLPKE